MAALRLRSHSCPSPINTSGSERIQLDRTPDLCSNPSGSQSFLPPYLASDDNVSSLSPHVMLVWISEVFGHHGLLISNGTTMSTTEIRTLQWQPHSSSHFWLISTTLCRTPGLQRRSITCPSPCAQANPCSKGCSVTSPTRLIGFKSKCLLRFHWAIRGQIWHPLLLSLSHFSADILEGLGEFQVVTCNLAAHSQALLSADKAATSQGKADSCCSKEPLKPLLNHLLLLLLPLSISFFFFWKVGENKCEAILFAPGFPKFQNFQILLDLFKIYYCTSWCSQQLHYGMGQKLAFTLIPLRASVASRQQILNSRFWQNNAHTVYSFPLLPKK